MISLVNGCYKHITYLILRPSPSSTIEIDASFLVGEPNLCWESDVLDRRVVDSK